jgi:hypothetical protein
VLSPRGVARHKTAARLLAELWKASPIAKAAIAKCVGHKHPYSRSCIEVEALSELLERTNEPSSEHAVSYGTSPYKLFKRLRLFANDVAVLKSIITSSDTAPMKQQVLEWSAAPPIISIVCIRAGSS